MRQHSKTYAWIHPELDFLQVVVVDPQGSFTHQHESSIWPVDLLYPFCGKEEVVGVTIWSFSRLLHETDKKLKALFAEKLDAAATSADMVRVLVGQDASVPTFTPATWYDHVTDTLHTVFASAAEIVWEHPCSWLEIGRHEGKIVQVRIKEFKQSIQDPLDFATSLYRPRL